MPRVLASFCLVPVFPAWWNVRIRCPEGMHTVCWALTSVQGTTTESVSKAELLLNGLCPWLCTKLHLGGVRGVFCSGICLPDKINYHSLHACNYFYIQNSFFSELTCLKMLIVKPYNMVLRLTVCFCLGNCNSSPSVPSSHRTVWSSVQTLE